MVVLLGNIFATSYKCTKEKKDRLSVFVKEQSKDEFHRSFLSVKVSNGEFFINISCLKNHNGSYIKKVITFFEDLPNILGESSFGFLYLYDDEGGLDVHDKVQLYVLRKGKVTIEKDSYFSPFSKMVSPDGNNQL